MSLTYREKRVYFTRMACDLVLWINTADWAGLFAENGVGSLDDAVKVECAGDEWMIHSPRQVKVGVETVMAQDRRHSPSGHHPRGTAWDINLYINGEYITDGNHPIWKIINRKARGMDPLFGLGLSFNDANHLSYGESQ